MCLNGFSYFFSFSREMIFSIFRETLLFFLEFTHRSRSTAAFDVQPYIFFYTHYEQESKTHNKIFRFASVVHVETSSRLVESRARVAVSCEQFEIVC